MTRWLVAVALLTCPTARADRPGKNAAIMIATAWMNAAHKATPQGLADAVSLTGLPFWYDGISYPDAASAKICKQVGDHGTADAKTVQGVLDCLRHGNGKFLESDAWSISEPAALPAAFKKQQPKLAELARTHTLVLSHVTAKQADDWAVLAVDYSSDDKAHVAGLVIAHQTR